MLNDFSFKSIIRSDNIRTFMNPIEFGEMYVIDGKKMRVITDKSELIDRQPDSAANGITSAEILIYVAAADYGEKPKPGKLLLWDNKRQYRILDCVDEDGIYSLTLEALRG